MPGSALELIMYNDPSSFVSYYSYIVGSLFMGFLLELVKPLILLHLVNNRT